MNIQEFVKTSLVQVISGIAEAREAVAPNGALVGSDKAYGWTKDAKIITDAHGRIISQVEFDIALTTADSKDTKGGIGVFLGSVGVGSQGASHGENTSHSRIKFSVPVVFPGEKE